MFFRVVGAKRFIFAGRKVRESCVRPNLTMGVRIACAHQFAAIFENLDVANPRDFSENGKLFGPGVNDTV